MSFWDAIWTGIVAALVASLVWFALFRLLRPRVKIAPVAAWDPESGIVRFKLLNVSQRALIDLRFQLDVMRPRVGPKGITYTRNQVPIEFEPPLVLSGNRRGSDDANAYRVAATLNPDQVFDGQGNHFVRLQVFGRDTVSGVGGVSSQTYPARTDFIHGNYEKGQTFAIVPPHLEI